MQIEFLGHAGLFIESKDVSLVCDPWFSKTGGFLASWHQFPLNEHLDIKKLREADALYISHRHHDHLDKILLEKFPKDIALYIAHYTSNYLKDELTKLGFRNIRELNDWEKVSLGKNFDIMLLTDPGKYKEDSSIIITADGFKILNKNDCYLSNLLMQKISQDEIDLLFTQFSGAIWYPMAYHYDHEKKKELAKITRQRLLDSFFDVIKTINARYVVPFAGPPCFLDDEFFEFNFDEGIFMDQSELKPYLEKMSLKYNLMNPGDTVTLKNDSIKFNNENGFDFSRKKEILLDYKKKRMPYIQSFLNSIPDASDDLYDRFADHIYKISALSRYITSNIQQLVEFNIEDKNGGTWQVDFRNEKTIVHKAPVGKPQYTFWVKSKILDLVLKGEILWDDLLLSMRFRAARKPDVYNWALFALLQFSYDDNLLIRAENMELRSKSPVTINVKYGNKLYKIQRFCPHLNEDLRSAKIEDGILTCSRHQWKFDLTNQGKCISGGNRDLAIYATSDLDEAEETGAV